MESGCKIKSQISRGSSKGDTMKREKLRSGWETGKVFQLSTSKVSLRKQRKHHWGETVELWAVGQPHRAVLEGS